MVLGGSSQQGPTKEQAVYLNPKPARPPEPPGHDTVNVLDVSADPCTEAFLGDAGGLLRRGAAQLMSLRPWREVHDPPFLG